jgi:Excinuclease ATPase subunit
MIDKLATRRFLAVVGTSGCGKSSLVNCGLQPALHRGLMSSAGSAWRVAQFRPGLNPRHALAAALAAPGVLFRDDEATGITLSEIVDATLEMSSLGVVDIYEQARLAPDVNLLLVVDQFEEIFRYHRLRGDAVDDFSGMSSGATAFVKLLLEARTHPRIHVVLTMRSDFLGECAQFHGLPEAINEGQYLVPRMSRDETRAAIVGPAETAGCEVDAVLLPRLLNDVGDNPDQLSILQHALNRTWSHWMHEGSARGRVDLEHYEAVGAMAQALDRHAEKAFAELQTDRLKRVCELVFRALTDKGTDARGIRRPTPFANCARLPRQHPRKCGA